MIIADWVMYIIIINIYYSNIRIIYNIECFEKLFSILYIDTNKKWIEMVVALIISNIVGMYLSYMTNTTNIPWWDSIFTKIFAQSTFWLFTQTFYQFKTNLHLRFVVAICWKRLALILTSAAPDSLNFDGLSWTLATS